MDFSALLRPEMITALSVSLGALLGGVVAVVAEIRNPDKAERVARKAADKAVRDREGAGSQEVVGAIRDECDHVNRSVWIVEKKLADRLHALEKQVQALANRV